MRKPRLRNSVASAGVAAITAWLGPWNQRSAAQIQDSGIGKRAETYSGKAGVKARRERQSALAAIAPHQESDRPFGRDVDAVGPGLGDQPGDLRLIRQRQPQIPVARQRKGAERLRGEKADLDAKPLCRLRHHGQRADHPVDLGMPRIGRDQDAHQAARAATEATGAARRSGSVQVMISNRPSSCSTSAVQLSTQSPQFM